ncbi:DUF4019 domain-containing protein [Sphingomonas sp. LY29]|uniref:DUF4019 domain-containing protein n=1 Tax=Sphingomonas sp. LY29 TaxID=3095341 RepID=UPI002D7A3A91|nr:DUF4019 domain-containing protein [Sphingomonas sp. LY29]WRP26391.1 DUF4019 domain-containing protein [Sphingomonas sp. LY29]
MFSNLIVAVSALVVADPSNVAVEAAAGEWVALVDQQKWADSWSEAGALFRSQITSVQWAAAVQPVRTPLGVVHSRKLQKVTPTKSLPGAPDGDYRIVEFRTAFANKADAFETVILAREASGWAVNGYFVR